MTPATAATYRSQVVCSDLSARRPGVDADRPGDIRMPGATYDLLSARYRAQADTLVQMSIGDHRTIR